MSVRFLFYFAHDFHSFRVPELKSLEKLYELTNLSYSQSPLDSPFLTTSNDSHENIIKLCQRSVLMRSAYELWAEGSSFDEIVSELDSRRDHFHNIWKELARRKNSYKVDIVSFRHKIAQKDKIKMVESLLRTLNLSGSLNLSCPDHRFVLFVDQPGSDRCYFGRWLSDSNRESIQQFNLKSRKLVGTTCMDPQLSLLMGNQALVSHGHLVFDPFCGTGSILLACASMGAYVIGADINFVLLHGRGKSSRAGRGFRLLDENIWSTFAQYGLQNQLVGVVLSDFSGSLRNWRHTPHAAEDNEFYLFDSIVTDPPYGVRESNRRIGQTVTNSGCAALTSSQGTSVDAHLNSVHYPASVTYGMSHLYLDLLNFAALHLRLYGRLVFWFPWLRSMGKTEHYEADISNCSCELCQHLPKHACLKLLACSEQILTERTSRLLVTMEKFIESRDEQKAWFEKDLFQSHSFRDAHLNCTS